MTQINLLEVMALVTPFLVLLLIVVLFFIHIYTQKKMDNVAKLLYSEKEIFYNQINQLFREMGYLKKSLEVIEKASERDK